MDCPSPLEPQIAQNALFRSEKAAFARAQSGNMFRFFTFIAGGGFVPGGFSLLVDCACVHWLSTPESEVKPDLVDKPSRPPL